MMQQYHEAKQACGDAILLFRMGDFYELFFDDAKTVARELGLTLTSRDKGDNPIPMAGFPHHQLESYLAKLIRCGYRAAICEQVEDPKKAKGLVRREVTRIVSRGTVTDDALLSPEENNYLAAIVTGDPAGLAWVDISTGRFSAGSFSRQRLGDQIAQVSAVEYLVSDDDKTCWDLPGHAVCTRRPGWAFAVKSATDALNKQFGTRSLEGFGFDPEGQPGDVAAIRAAGAILDYLHETQKSSLAHLDRLERFERGTALEIDPATRRSLEITRTIRDGRREGSLLGAIDRTVSAMGARLLADWVAAPLAEPAGITARLDAVGELVEESSDRHAIREQLRSIFDIQRLLARVTTGRASPRDLSSLGRTLAVLPRLEPLLVNRRADRWRVLASRFDLCVELGDRLLTTLVDDCPLSARDGDIIRVGVNAELDELRGLARGGKQWIAEYQAREIERTGIPNIKVGFNKVFGYYLEITHAHSDKVPENYHRKQTIKAAERYITPELKEYEERVLSAEDRSRELEYELFLALREQAAAAAPRLAATAAVLAEADVLSALAFLAVEQGYCRPSILDEPVLVIREGRHPVLDVLEPTGTFVPNDARLGDDDQLGRVAIITGPNMAGKSTYIRQVALITMMAQMGSFVPAREATIGIADRVFARVGASDELARGQSTFMVEMTETARILNTATRRSLVILDEIGRGTSTYDGVSLAWSIVEYLHDTVGCRTLFATHYHELTDLANSLERVQNLNVAVREWNDDVVFLHQIVAGAADKSYGIHVARLAGVPRQVNERAKEILAILEDEHIDPQGRPKVARHNGSGGPLQLTLFGPADHPIVDKLRELDIDQIAPLEALTLLSEWQRELRSEDQTSARSAK